MPFRVAFTWGKFWLGLFGVVDAQRFLGGKAAGGKVDGTGAARCVPWLDATLQSTVEGFGPRRLGFLA